VQVQKNSKKYTLYNQFALFERFAVQASRLNIFIFLRNTFHFAETSEVLTAECLQIQDCWDVTLCLLVGIGVRKDRSTVIFSDKQPWRWMQQRLSKRRETLTLRQSAASQNTYTFLCRCLSSFFFLFSVFLFFFLLLLLLLLLLIIILILDSMVSKVTMLWAGRSVTRIPVREGGFCLL